MFLSLLLLIAACLDLAASANLFVPQKVLALELVDVKVVRRSKRDLASHSMASFYDIHLSANGKQISGRLERRSAMEGFEIDNNADWATYTSEQLDGVFLVRRRGRNDSGLAIEGFLVYEKTPYLLQPHATSEDHVLHQTHGPFEKAYSESLVYDRVKRKPPHDLHGQLRFRVLVVADLKTQEIIKRQFKGQAAFSVEKYLQQYVGVYALFVNRRLETMDKWGLVLRCVVDLDIRKTAIEPITRLEHKKQGIKETSSLHDTLKAFTKFMSATAGYRHVVLLTGYVLLNDQKVNVGGVANLATMCTNEAMSVVEFDFLVDNFRVFTHEMIHSFNVSHDGKADDPIAKKCRSSDNFIMSDVQDLPYSLRSRDNWWSFSHCSYKMILDFLKSLPKARVKKCFSTLYTADYPPLTGQYFSGSEMTLDRQCQLFLGPEAYYGSLITLKEHAKQKVDNSLPSTITETPSEKFCTQGIPCSIFNEKTGDLTTTRFIPYPGTPCGKKKVCDENRCVQESSDEAKFKLLKLGKKSVTA